MVSVAHISDDDLEKFAMRTLPESACAALEEHLLVCPSCRDRLTATDEHVAAMKAAAKKSVTKKTAPVAAPPPPRCLHAADHLHFVERLCQHIKCSEIQGFGPKVFVRKA